MPGLVYKFDNQNISTFEDNIKFMGDLSFSIYFDLATTCGKKSTSLRKLQRCTPFPMPLLSLSIPAFNHTFEQLNDVSYLSNEMLKFFDPITAKQLRDCVRAVFDKKERYSLIEMFSCELKFVIDNCKKRINEKFTRRYLELDLFRKQRFKRDSPIQWVETKCSICNFDLAVGASNGPHEEKMTYFDFVVKKEHSFITNIFDSDELSACYKIKTLKNYFKNFKFFLQID